MISTVASTEKKRRIVLITGFNAFGNPPFHARFQDGAVSVHLGGSLPDPTATRSHHPQHVTDDESIWEKYQNERRRGSSSRRASNLAREVTTACVDEEDQTVGTDLKLKMALSELELLRAEIASFEGVDALSAKVARLEAALNAEREKHQAVSVERTQSAALIRTQSLAIAELKAKVVGSTTEGDNVESDGYGILGGMFICKCIVRHAALAEES